MFKLIINNYSLNNTEIFAPTAESHGFS